jgi:thiamine transport system substrate-binding protein
MLGKDFQEDMPLQMFVYPVNPEAVLPEVYVKYNQVPETTGSLDAQLIAEKRDVWIQAWMDTVLR